jgi:hypothetical protein
MCDFYFFQFFLFFFSPFVTLSFWVLDNRWMKEKLMILVAIFLQFGAQVSLESHTPHPPFSLLLETFIFTCVVVAQKLEHANSTILVSIYLSDPSGQTANCD